MPCVSHLAVAVRSSDVNEPVPQETAPGNSYLDARSALQSEELSPSTRMNRKPAIISVRCKLFLESGLLHYLPPLEEQGRTKHKASVIDRKSTFSNTEYGERAVVQLTIAPQTSSLMTCLRSQPADKDGGPVHRRSANAQSDDREHTSLQARSSQLAAASTGHRADAS
ncbi:hypothetical protein BC629DRAFT_1441870 [Irpex lacteus]|nr:hypothetical protein BC629DRAFT_1441870 [Irpex lacteus]